MSMIKFALPECSACFVVSVVAAAESDHLVRAAASSFAFVAAVASSSRRFLCA